MRWLPYSIYIAAYNIDSEGRPEYKDLVEQLYHTYGGNRSKELDSLRFESGPYSVYVRALSGRGFRVFLLAAGYADLRKEGLGSTPLDEKLDGIVRSLKETLPERADSSYRVRFAYAADDEEAGSLIRRYGKEFSLQLRSAGLVRGCLLANFGKSGSSTLISSSELMVFPCGLSLEDASDTAWLICFEVCSLATYIGEMNRLYSERELMLDQIDASENSTQLRINEILSQMRRPVDEIQPV